MEANLLYFTNGTYDLTSDTFMSVANSSNSQCLGYPAGRSDTVETYEYVPYDKNSPAAQQLRDYIKTLQPEKSKRDFLYNILAETLSPTKRSELCYVFVGTGSNGITTFLNFVASTFGPLALNKNSPIENLNESHRIYLSNDINISLMKSLCSGDTFQSRDVNGDVKYITSNVTPIADIGSNQLNNITDDGAWRRLLFLTFDTKFVDTDADNQIADRINNLRSTLMAKLIRRWSLLRDGGIVVPEAVNEATRQYRLAQVV